MVGFLRLRNAIFCLVIAFGGCASEIKTYDSTFTSTLLSESAASLGSSTTNFKRSTAGRKSAVRKKRPYFIEFRARQALTYGHALVVFGKLDKNGKIPVDKKGVLIPGVVEISGLHPASTSTIPWSVGHVVPVPAETGPSDGDFEDEYATARYQINLTKNEFDNVVAIVSKHKKLGVFWSGPLKNCMNYINDIAHDLGLKTPRVPVRYVPKEYVNSLKAMNKGRRIL